MKQAGHFWGQEHISHRFYFLITQGETKMRHEMWEFTLLDDDALIFKANQVKKVTWHFLGIHQVDNLIKGKHGHSNNNEEKAALLSV